MNDWHNQVIAWWGGERVRLAFGVAPLALPAIMALSAALTEPWPGALLLAVWVAVSSLPLSYVVTLAVGVPVYRFLCARNLTAFWMAPVAGFLAGTAAGIILYFLVMVTLGLHLSPIGKDTLITLLPGFFLACGLPGAISGTIVWLIARPDRQERMRGALDQVNSDAKA